MSCVTLRDGVVICGVGPHLYGRTIQPCPVCERRRRMVRRYGGVWYGDTLTCLGCGDSWSSGWRMQRPFRRGWRQEAIREAKAKWAQAVNSKEYRRRVMADLDEEMRISEELRHQETSS